MYPDSDEYGNQRHLRSLFGLQRSITPHVVAVGQERNKDSIEQVLVSLGLPLILHERANDVFSRQHELLPAIVLADYRLPDTDGISFLARIYRIWPATVRILFRPEKDRDWLDLNAGRCHVSVCLDEDNCQQKLLQFLLYGDVDTSLQLAAGMG